MSSVLAKALGRSGKKAGRVRATTEDPVDAVEEDEDVVAATDETDPDAEGEEEEVAAAANEPDPDAEGDDDDYVATDEETDDEMAASNRGASRVLAIMTSPAGLSNPAAAAKVAGNAKLSAAEAIDLLGDMKPSAAATTAKRSVLNDRLRGKAKALAPDGVVKPAAADPQARRAAAYEKYKQGLSARRT